MPKQTPDKTRAAEQRFSGWMKRYHQAELIRQAQELSLRRDMVTLLTFVRDNKVVGTQGAGNMPLKAVREVTARFVKPPQLDSAIGDHTYRLRSEADIWPLYYLRILAEVGGLLATGPARQWRLTPHGKKFLDTDPLLQVSLLLTVWWYHVNWLIAYPYEGMGEALPPSFNLFTLDRLLSLSMGKSIPFEKFADGLIESAGLTWGARDSSMAASLLRSSIARMVIHILANFGAVNREYREEPLGKGTTSKLVAFEITPFGQALLHAVAIMND